MKEIIDGIFFIIFVICVLFSVLVKISRHGDKMQRKKESYKFQDNFRTASLAEGYLISVLNQQFPGETFEIVRDFYYEYVNDKKDTYIRTKIRDYNGVVAKALITSFGPTSLVTDYKSCANISTYALPVEELLNQFDFIENYSIKQVDLDVDDEQYKHNDYINVFPEGNLQISIFLNGDEKAETIRERAMEVYNIIKRNIQYNFELFFILSNDLYYGISRFSKVSKVEGYYGYYAIKLRSNDFKDEIHITKKIRYDQPLRDREKCQGLITFKDCGVIWKTIPEKRYEEDNLLVYKKLNARYKVVKEKADYYLVDYARPTRLTTYLPFFQFLVRARAYKVDYSRLKELKLKRIQQYEAKSSFLSRTPERVGDPREVGKDKDSDYFIVAGLMFLAIFVIGALYLMFSGWCISLTINPYITILGFGVVYFLIEIIRLSVLKPPFDLEGLEKVELVLTPKRLSMVFLIWGGIVVSFAILRSVTNDLWIYYDELCIWAIPAWIIFAKVVFFTRTLGGFSRLVDVEVKDKGMV
ncbi:MAG: DUF443 family protein [Lachnospiraceae bacterium]|nr:DUF443 family protein [Lachnospiraceae bacterium]